MPGAGAAHLPKLRSARHIADLEVEAARNAGLDGPSAYLNGAMTFLGGQGTRWRYFSNARPQHLLA